MKPVFIKSLVLQNILSRSVLLLVTGMLSLLSTQVFAGSAQEQLKSFYKDVQSMRADFTQTVSSNGMLRQDVSKGVLRMQRPGKFRWDYSEPYEQQIVADGKQLWVFDMDLDQVIVKPLDIILGQTPAILLSGTADLADKFIINEVTDSEVPEVAIAQTNKNLVWLKLEPKQSDSSYQQLLLAFENNDLQQMELVDSFGQATRLVFTNLERNPVIEASVFMFVPPAGVDVIGEQNQ